MKKRLYIGIDPSAAKAGNIGICAAYSKTEIETLTTFNFFDAQDYLMETFYKCAYDKKETTPLVVVEDSNINGGAFNRGLTGARREKQNRDLGKNQFCSYLLIEWCKKMSYQTIALSPKEKGGKWPEKLFFERSGYDKKVLKKHQHAIDGYTLIYRFLNARNPEELIRKYLTR